jgi:hypothetical protein
VIAPNHNKPEFRRQSKPSIDSFFIFMRMTQDGNDFQIGKKQFCALVQGGGLGVIAGLGCGSHEAGSGMRSGVERELPEFIEVLRGSWAILGTRSGCYPEVEGLVVVSPLGIGFGNEQAYFCQSDSPSVALDHQRAGGGH